MGDIKKFLARRGGFAVWLRPFVTLLVFLGLLWFWVYLLWGAITDWSWNYDTVPKVVLWPLAILIGFAATALAAATGSFFSWLVDQTKKTISR